MASSDYDSGFGGKFRKRPFRRSSATTPYDRPQTAVRRTNPNPNSNGWISKIVNPASRILYRGASKIFFSVFQKRLTAPPPQDQDENHSSRLEPPEVVHNSEKPSDEVLEPSSNSGDNVTSNYGTDETQQEKPCTKGFFELEQLLKHKTFTRAEFDHLTDLLRLRTVESSTSNLQNGKETEEEAVVTEQAKHNEEEPSMPQPAVTCERVENALNSEHGRMKSLNLRGNISNSTVNLHILEKEAVPPEEIAKAYMDSRHSKLSPSTQSLRSRLQDDFTLPIVSYAKKRSTALVDSRSSILFPGNSEHSENGYITPRPRGRSALYKMSRSPYFKVHAATDSRVRANGLAGLRVGDGLASSSPSPKVLLSNGRQVLKRGNSVLDNDGGSFAPIRRTRQKSLLMPSSQRDSSPCCITGNGEGTYPFASIGQVPPQSTEMAMKIFQELDKLVPSPSEKSPQKNGSGICEVASDSHLPTLRSSISPKQNTKAAGKSTGNDCDMGNSVTSATIIKSAKEMAATTHISFPAATSEREPDVQMSMVQESVWLDSKSDKLSEKAPSSSSNSIPSSSVLKGKTIVDDFDRPATVKGVSSSAFQPTAAVQEGTGLPTSSVLFNSSASTSGTTSSCTSFITAAESPTPLSPSKTPANGIFRFSASGQFSSQGLSSAQNNLSTLQKSTVQSTSFASVPTFGSSSYGFSSSSFATAVAAGNLFSSSSQPPSTITSTFGSNPSLPTKTTSLFSFSSVNPANSSASPLASKPVFGTQQQAQATGFGLGSPGNDHMNVEDCMTDAPAPLDPTFGQPSNSLSNSTVQFGAPAATPLGGSFSVGTSGGDKSGRRIIRVKRDKQRKR